MEKGWSRFFHFSRKERTGVIVLLLAVAACWAIPLLPVFRPAPVTTDTAFAAAVQAFEQQLSAKSTATLKLPVRLFYFDPNSLPEAGWEQLGVPPKVVRNIQRYLAGGGRFRHPEDLQRIYTLPPEVYSRLAPYIRIAERVITEKNKRKWNNNRKRDSVDRRDSARRSWYSAKQPRCIDINTADTLQWQALPGIGPGYARRIVGFRERLGGFHSIAQIGETYGLPDTVFKKIQPLLQIGSSSLKKIDINHADEKSLAHHPYIRYKLAGLIVRYRSMNGPFRQVEELRRIPLVDEIIYRKIEHYIHIKL